MYADRTLRLTWLSSTSRYFVGESDSSGIDGVSSSTGTSIELAAGEGSDLLGEESRFTEMVNELGDLLGPTGLNMVVVGVCISGVKD